MTDQEIALLIGELKGTMIAVQSNIFDLHKELRMLSTNMSGLPCVQHAQDIDTVKKWVDSHKEFESVKTKSQWDFRTELAKGGLIILGGVLTLLMTWILKGG